MHESKDGGGETSCVFKLSETVGPDKNTPMVIGEIQVNRYKTVLYSQTIYQTNGRPIEGIPELRDLVAAVRDKKQQRDDHG